MKDRKVIVKGVSNIKVLWSEKSVIVIEDVSNIRANILR